MNFKSDDRQHGTASLSPAMVDELAPRFAAASYIPLSDGCSYVESPVCARGVPYSLSCGVHAAVDHLLDAVDEVRSAAGGDAATAGCELSVRTRQNAAALSRTLPASAQLRCASHFRVRVWHGFASFCVFRRAGSCTASPSRA